MKASRVVPERYRHHQSFEFDDEAPPSQCCDEVSVDVTGKAGDTSPRRSWATKSQKSLRQLLSIISIDRQGLVVPNPLLGGFLTKSGKQAPFSGRRHLSDPDLYSAIVVLAFLVILPLFTRR
jgi:hypothetical protein